MPHFFSPRHAEQGTLIRAFWSGMVLALLLGGASPAAAHLVNANASLIPVSGVLPAKIVAPGSLQFSPNRGGQIKFKLHGVLNPVTGKAITSVNNSIAVDLVINGVPQTFTATFSIKSGNVQGSFPSLNLLKNDLVEIEGAAVKDSNGVQFGTMGLKHPGLHFTTAVIPVFGVPVDIDADARIIASNGGKFILSIELESPPLTTTNNKVELEILVNGAGPLVISKTFDIINGDGFVSEPLGLLAGDIVEVLRIDVYDSSSVRFATAGIRILSPL
ncbi:MAG: hypothetical protein HYZ50_06610 [Deltaproteobacteria bacterium]|nr:hypothetical protein [Deltaproteobacteria bacterium]